MDMKRDTQRGAALVEFAMVLPLLMVILMGIIEFGIILYDKSVITNASREAARSMIVYDSPDSATIANKIVADYANLLITFGGDTLTVEDITFEPQSVGTVSYMKASVGFTYKFLYSPIGGSLDLTASTTMREEE